MLAANYLLVPAASALEPVAATNSASWKGSAAFFVGVSQFDPDSGLGALRYTADDAVGLAQLYVQELKLVPPQHVWIALSGQPTATEMKNALETLKLMGVKQIPADRKSLLQTVKEAANTASAPDGLILMTFSTHGFDTGGQAFLMPSDGQASDVETTGVPLNSIKNTLQKAAAAKRLLFVDACRQPVTATTRGDEQMPEGFYKALAGSSGFGVVMSCVTGEKSWEDEKFQHGVFTHFLIEALRGKAPSDPTDGFIHLRDAANYASGQTKDWVWREKNANQDPRIGGDTEALSIPLGMDPEQRDQIKALRARADTSVESLRESRRNNPKAMSSELYAKVLTLLDSSTGAELEHLVSKLEDVAKHKTDASYLDDFVAWFNGKYGNLARPAEPTPIPAARSPQASAPGTPEPPSSGALAPQGQDPGGVKPSIRIQFDPAGQKAAQLWSAATAAQFRDLLAQALRDDGIFTVHSDSPPPGRGTAAKPGSQGDYVLNIRVDSFEHRLDQAGGNIGFFKVNVANTFTPKSTLTVGWGIKRTADNVELKTDLVTSSRNGQNVTSQNQRAAAWPDASVIKEIAGQISTAASQLNLNQ
jgi:hypothetical protein